MSLNNFRIEGQTKEKGDVVKYEYRDRPVEPPLFTEQIDVERKKFFLDLKENNRGRFLKITEDVAGHRDTIIVPSEILGELIEALERIRDFDESLVDS